uniref:PDZ and LIM domain protein 7-like n=1 Tax=Styela clava TaxID=7725 RepID=UPI00193AC1E3|nr:PDZ and LIM domain protein 7-like [Styela clava]
MSYSLEGGSPWGFRLTGGKDFRTELVISKITPGGKADRAGIKCGMALSEINNQPTANMTHMEAQGQVKNAGHTLVLIVKNKDNSVSYATSGVENLNISSPPKPSVQTSATYVKPVQTSVPQPNRYQPSKPAPTPDFLPPPPADEPLPPPPQSMLGPGPQMKQQSNKGDESDPICEGCRKIILGPYLSHQGKNWHIDEFVCAASNCRKPLQNIGFIDEGGERYCKDCYEKHFAHTCGKCHKKVVGEVMHALGQTWHMTCFVCKACGQTFKDGVFQMQGDQPYCITDYNRLFSQVCKGCNFTIEAGDSYLEALSAQWHDTCFECAVCHCDLKTVGFFAAGGKPVCSNHRNARVA